MPYDFKNFKQKTEEVKNWLSGELTTIRTGRATPVILDSVMVESYGAKMPLKQISSISIEDARTLRVSPWNSGQIRDVEKAVSNSNLGLSVVVDDKGLRVIFPELTSERREALIKVAKDKIEKARVSLRGERDQVWNDIQKKQKDGAITEDEKFKLKEERKKIIDQANKSLDDAVKKKEEEIKN